MAPAKRLFGRTVLKLTEPVLSLQEKWKKEKDCSGMDK